MAESNIKEVKTGEGAIGIELNEQAELILKAYNIVIACKNVALYMSSAIAALPEVSSQGVFKQYIANDGDLNLYVMKAQEMEILASILHQFAEDTYATFVEMDNIQAMQIANLILNTNIPATSNVPAEQQSELSKSQDFIRNNQQEAFDKIKSMEQE
ncbi:hypothetical protein [Streptococcus gordonii]|uniref:Uncharacterized protein n=1 Tax=Streptococcus gordonii (strain Challis / ATCC 35105 / BCRC 15272 / CH1 / DL1 / V288) TaxID=467705 RepID=A8AUE1_STRGC|nr:hypothetical protein [Streptococcus gordonii]ABV10947.1 hypothetical protein SGO_0079 [Streptococcus gordonii str. Challis substr. CH1]MBZ2138373.1 hypothetical protein [Streptococcus gordonii]QGS44462.1 hypothetical protein FOB91_07155 [Streptococcus gordonii]VEE20164.1 Uncharacterised protein [Streptococcus gordonii]VTS76391.1 Uncharacterised protein [Streptococcus gordonii]